MDFNKGGSIVTIDVLMTYSLKRERMRFLMKIYQIGNNKLLLVNGFVVS